MTAPLETSKLDMLIADGKPVRGQHYRIGALAAEFGVTLRTLRFYEDRGLIAPRRQGTTRLYSEHDRSRLKLLLLAKRVGFPIAGIQSILDIYDGKAGMDDPTAAVLRKFAAQRAVLEQRRQEAEATLKLLDETIADLERLAD